MLCSCAYANRPIILPAYSITLKPPSDIYSIDSLRHEG